MTVLRDYAAGLTQPMLDSTGGAGAPYDEVVGPDGALRAPWKGLAELAVALTPADLRRVDGDIVRALADDGVTYSRAGLPTGSGTGPHVEPWRLDAVPVVIDAAQWTPLEVGLAQRAELLNAILADLYGRQRLLSDGVLPAAVVLGHPGFVRVVARQSATDPRPLVLAATDLGRDHRGEWRVLADHTRRRRASAMPWRTGASCRGCCPSSIARPACTGWSRSSAPFAPHSCRARPATSPTRAWSC